MGDLRIKILTFSSGSSHYEKQRCNLKFCFIYKYHPGMIAISTITISLAFSPYIVRFFPRFRATSITWRCFLLLTGNVLSYLVVSGVDEMVRKDPSGFLAFIVIGVSRVFQGACSGIFFVIVQVRIVKLLNRIHYIYENVALNALTLRS